MPLYDYDCAACGRRFEVIHGVDADPPTSCPLCGSGPVRKAIAAPAIHFKGSGWAKKERRASARSGSSASGGDADASEVGSGAGTGAKGSSGDGVGDGAASTGSTSSTTPKTGSSPAKTSGSDGD